MSAARRNLSGFAGFWQTTSWLLTSPAEPTTVPNLWTPGPGLPGLLWLCISLMPRARVRDPAARAAVSLEVEAGLTVTVGKRRQTLFTNFVQWMESELDCRFNQLSASGLLLAAALTGFGKFLFYSGSPKYVFSEKP